jgi:hypothetical protein
LAPCLEPLHVPDELSHLWRAGRIACLGHFIPWDVNGWHEVADGFFLSLEPKSADGVEEANWHHRHQGRRICRTCGTCRLGPQ